MIDPKSLRVGNLVNHIDRSGSVHLPSIVVWEVVEIVTEGVRVVVHGDNPAQVANWGFIKHSDTEGIALSPSLLERAGFDTITDNPDGSQNYWNKEEDCSIDVETHILTTKLEILFYFRLGGNNRKALRDLHKLQNLFYELKDKELELKP